MKKRVLSILMALVMVIGLLPTSALAAGDVYIVAGVDSLCGSNWDGTDVNNQMTKSQYSDQIYTKVFEDVAVGENYQLKVVKNGSSWYGDSSDNNVTFNVTAVSDVTVTFNTVSQIVQVSGPAVTFNTTLEVEVMTAVGSGAGNWLNGAAWDPAAEENAMTEIKAGVYQITYEDVPAGENYGFKFAANGSWGDNWGGTFTGSGVTGDAVYNSNSNITMTIPELSDVTLTLDLSGFDYSTKSGATFKVDITPVETAPATHTVSFDANGGTGAMDPVTGVSGEYTLPACAFTAPANKEFAGWAESAGGSVISGSTITVDADTTLYAVWKESSVISSIEITDVTVPVLGETTDHSFTIPADAAYVKCLSDDGKGDCGFWAETFEKPEDYSDMYYSNWYYESFGDLTFQGGYWYTFGAIVAPAEGKSFAEDVTVTFNGEEGSFYDNGRYAFVWYSFYCEAPPKEPINSIEITDVTAPVAGEAEDYDYTIPTGAGYEKCYDSDYDCSAWVLSSEKPTSYDELNEGRWYYDSFVGERLFESGNWYTFVARLTSDTDRVYAEDMTVTVNGQSGSYQEEYGCIYVWSSFYCEEAAEEPITSIEITDVVVPVANKYLNFDFAIPEGEGYAMYKDQQGDCAAWMVSGNKPETFNDLLNNNNWKWESLGTTTAAEGNWYTLVVRLTEENGYALDAANVTATINGQPANVSTGYIGEEYFYVWCSYQCEADPNATFGVYFDANGGTGAMDPVIDVSGDYILPECTFIAPEGMEFGGWSVGWDIYQPGDTVQINQETVINAQWKPSILDHTKPGYTLVWSEGFEDSADLPDGWSNEDKDGDGEMWFVASSGYNACHGGNGIWSASYTSEALTPDNWLHLPEMTLEEGEEYIFTFAMAALNSSWSGDKVGLFISADGGQTYTQLGEDHVVPYAAFVEMVTDLSAYAGQTIKLALVHHNCTDQYITMVDCLKLWKKNAAASYTVSFDANGGAGAMEPVTGLTGEYTLPECAFTAPDGFRFAGWSAEADGEPIAGESIQVIGDLTLYAVWEEDIQAITSIEVSGVSAPVAGKFLIYDFEFPADGHYGKSQANQSLWVITQEKPTQFDDLTRGAIVYPTMGDLAAENDYWYTFVAMANPEEGWAITDETTASVNGNQADLMAGYENECYVWYSFQCEADPNATFDVYFDANGGAGAMDPVTGLTGEYTLPECAFTAPEGMEFNGWLTPDGNIVTGTIQVTMDMTLTADWVNIPIDHDRPGYTLAWSEGFEGSSGSLPAGWTSEDKDGDGYNWAFNEGYVVCHGDNALHSASYDNSTFAVLTPNNWLYLPEMPLEEGKEYLFTFAMAALNSSWSGDKVGLFISADGGQTYTQLGEDHVVPYAAFVEMVTDLSAYAGQTIKLALVHHNCTDQYITMVDCLKLWKKNAAASYTVSFDANGGAGAMEPVTDVSGDYTLPECAFTAPEDQCFLGWATSADGQVITEDTIQVTENTTLYAIWEPIPVNYDITEGNGQEVTKGNGATFVSSGPYDEFEGVEVDGRLLENTDFTSERGSTRVTLTADFVSSLSEGEHSIGIRFKDATASGYFTVVADDSDPGDSGSEDSGDPGSEDSGEAGGNDSPNTGDHSDLFWWLGLMVLSLCGFGALCLLPASRKKERRGN